jgi:hypothetical protein
LIGGNTNDRWEEEGEQEIASESVMYDLLGLLAEDERETTEGKMLLQVDHLMSAEAMNLMMKQLHCPALIAYHKKGYLFATDLIQ